MRVLRTGALRCRRIWMTLPNFSGTWRFNPLLSSLQIEAPHSSLFVIEHIDPIFRLTRTHVFPQKADTVSIGLKTDGSVVSFTKDDRRIQAHAYWDGESILFESKILRGDEKATNIVRYSLANDGNTIIAEEKLRSPSLNYDNIWILDRVGVQQSLTIGGE
jgi:hypothetical protein